MSAAAQATAGDARHPSAAFQRDIDQLIGKHAYSPDYPADSSWLDEGARYTVLEAAADGKGQELAAYDTATGARSVLVTEAQLTPQGAAGALGVYGYSWSDDRQHLLLFTNAQQVWRQRTRGDYWVLDLPGKDVSAARLHQLGGDAPAATLMFATFSPDSRQAAYVRAGNLYVEDLTGGSIRQLTKDGGGDLINGTSDWVNEEELHIRNAFRWSPDSKSIAYWQFDQSQVGEYTLLNDTRTLYPATFKYKYPLVGTTNSSVRAGVVSLASGVTTWVKLPGSAEQTDPRQHYIPRLDWAGNSHELAVEYLNRAQNEERIFLADARTGEAHVWFADKDASYIDIDATQEVMDRFSFLTDPAHPTQEGSPDAVWFSERDGWRHIYRVSRATGKLTLLTDFAADVIAPVALDQRHGFFYFTASPSDPVRAYLYRSHLDGTGKPERVTPAADKGTNSYTISPNGDWAIASLSSARQAPAFSLVHLPAYQTVRVLESNDKLNARLPAMMPSPVEFSETAIGGGISLSTFTIKPPNFDPAKKYPVFTYIYGEPASATVSDSFDTFGLFFELIAREGYIVVSFDNQGTPEPRGSAWRKAGYGAIGVLSTAQQAAAIRAYAAAHSYVDTSRMAIFGWSGGGTNTLNMMFRDPGLYSTGVAVAPVPDQTRYDTIYQERYMGLPAQNAQGYKDGSAINFAAGLSGNLLVVHGSGDDNVHFQGTELLVNKMIALGKQFDFMDYPNRTHGISEGPGTSVHVFTLIVRYVEDHVPAGAR